MSPIETHWRYVRSRLASQDITEAQLDVLREMFFGGALSCLAILAELNHAAKCDEEFFKHMDELFREASRGVLKRYGEGHEFQSTRRH